jgi:hypothetical protein
LIFACKNDHVLAVEAILQYDVQVNVRDRVNAVIFVLKLKVGKAPKHYTKNKTILALIRDYMIEHDQKSDSLIKGKIYFD